MEIIEDLNGPQEIHYKNQVPINDSVGNMSMKNGRNGVKGVGWFNDKFLDNCCRIPPYYYPFVFPFPWPHQAFQFLTNSLVKC